MAGNIVGGVSGGGSLDSNMLHACQYAGGGQLRTAMVVLARDLRRPSSQGMDFGGQWRRFGFADDVGDN